MAILKNGKVGIGTISPDVNLEVEGSTGVSIGEDVAGGTTNEEGILKLWSDGDNAYYTTIKTGTQTQAVTYTLPLDDGDASQYLQTNGAGVLDWITIAGGGDLLADGTVPLTANWDVGAFTITGLTFTSDQATGTAPFTVASTTEVANLHAATVTTNANLTGEVTSVGNATTIADTITVTGWTMGASVATTPAEGDNDTSLATSAFVLAETADILDGTDAFTDFNGAVIDSDNYAADSIDEEHLGTGFLVLPVQSAKIIGGCVTNGDATQGAQIEGGEDSWALLFDATTDEGACWDFQMPETYNTTTMTISLIYSMASGTADQVQWEGAWACHSEGEDLDTIGFDTLKEFAADTVENAAGEVSMVTQTFTSAESDGVVKGDLCQFQLSTDADDGTNDDATGDRELRAIYIRW